VSDSNRWGRETTQAEGRLIAPTAKVSSELGQKARAKLLWLRQLLKNTWRGTVMAFRQSRIFTVTYVHILVPSSYNSLVPLGKKTKTVQYVHNLPNPGFFRAVRTVPSSGQGSGIIYSEYIIRFEYRIIILLILSLRIIILLILLGIIRGIPRGLKNVTYVSYAWDRPSFRVVLGKSPQNTSVTPHFSNS
jgi:hypothetical protein